MALIRWDPRRKEVDPFRSLRRDVEHAFEDVFRGWLKPWPSRGGVPFESSPFIPSVDLKETDQEFILTAEIPGVEKGEIEVNITNDAVTVRGERKQKAEGKRGSYYLMESSFGSFQRVVPLPKEVLADEAKATLKEGVLTVTLPKWASAVGKGIRITVD
jgi:HSP20 family protein